MAMELSSLNIGITYDKLHEIFQAGSRSTISEWLTEFEQDNIFICTKKGTFRPRQLQSQYRFMLPEYCYVIFENEDTLESL